MGRRLTGIVAGAAVLALVIVAVVALATQTGQASAQTGQADTGVAVGASAQTDAAGQDCGDCAGPSQGAAGGSTDGTIQECPGYDTQAGRQPSGQTGNSGDGEACCPY
jgi:hypothetical protein